MIGRTHRAPHADRTPIGWRPRQSGVPKKMLKMYNSGFRLDTERGIKAEKERGIGREVKWCDKTASYGWFRVYSSSYSATDAFRFDLGLIFVNGEDFVAGLGYLIPLSDRFTDLRSVFICDFARWRELIVSRGGYWSANGSDYVLLWLLMRCTTSPLLLVMCLLFI